MPPLEWLQRTFEQINNGKHPEFGLPRRIELIIPLPVLGDEQLDATLIDTQGVDDVAERADLEQHFDDAHTVVVLCSVFNEAPATAVRQLLSRAKEAGVRTIKSHYAILVLPRPNEALAVKDNGVPVELAEEGYALKGEEVELKLHPLGLGGLSMEFFNAAEDEPSKLRDFLISRIRSVQSHHRDRLEEVIAGARALLENYEKEQAREAMREVARQLSVWLTHNATLGAPANMRVRDSLVAATRAAHVKTIYASVIREGDWPNLDYSHQLSHGARRIAASIVEPKLTGFREVATNILHDSKFEDAHDLVRQAIRALEAGFDALIRKTQLVGQSVYSDEMRSDLDFWRACNQEWGRGRGYRDRVAKHNQDWFDQLDHKSGDQRVVELVKIEWDSCMAALKELLKTD